MSVVDDTDSDWEAYLQRRAWGNWACRLRIEQENTDSVLG